MHQTRIINDYFGPTGYAFRRANQATQTATETTPNMDQQSHYFVDNNNNSDELLDLLQANNSSCSEPLHQPIQISQAALIQISDNDLATINNAIPTNIKIPNLLKNYICPITNNLPLDPIYHLVLVYNNQRLPRYLTVKTYYEREALQKWFKYSNTSPTTRLEIKEHELYSDAKLQVSILQFYRENKVDLPQSIIKQLNDYFICRIGIIIKNYHTRKGFGRKFIPGWPGCSQFIKQLNSTYKEVIKTQNLATAPFLQLIKHYDLPQSTSASQCTLIHLKQLFEYFYEE